MVTIRFQGTALQGEMNDNGKNAYEIVVDNAPPQKVRPDKGISLVELAERLAPGEHVVQMIKRTEAGVVGSPAQFRKFRLSGGGTLLEPRRMKRKIEIVGDSISCAYGIEAKNEREHFSPGTENDYLSYGAITARAMDAEYVCIAWSGRKMWPDNTMPEIYDLSLPTERGSQWDFSSWQPDVVLINLGTNDFHEIPDEKGWTAAYEAFIRHLRANYPKTVIYLASGTMMSDDWPPKIKALSVLNRYLEEIQSDLKAQGETQIRIIHFGTQDGAKDGLGGDWHPSITTHQKMAAKFEAALTADPGWTIDAK